jgi:hypothetical protein
MGHRLPQELSQAQGRLFDEGIGLGLVSQRIEIFRGHWFTK